MSSGPPSKKAKTASVAPVMELATDLMGRCFDIDFEKPSFIGMGPKIFEIGEKDADVVKSKSGFTKSTSISTDDSFSDKFSTKVDLSASCLCFSGSASFGLEKFGSRSKHTTRTTVENFSSLYTVSGSTKFILQPENFLNDDLAESIYEGNISLEKLEKVIGVFYARQIHLGGIFRRSYFIQKTKKETSLGIQSKLTAAFNGGLVGASSSFASTMTKKSMNKNSESHVDESIVGGDTEIWLGAGAHFETGGEKILEKWAESVNETNLHPVSYKLEFSWKLVEALNQSLGEDYKEFLQAKWEKQKITALKFVEDDKPPPPRYFRLKNGHGHYLCFSRNSIHRKVIVWSKTESTGQFWTWEDGKLKTRLGDKYLHVSKNSGARGAAIIVRSKPAEVEQGQQWAFVNGHLRNEKGRYLSVNDNGGRGNRLCQWSLSKKRNGASGQKWEEEYE